jgi:hypothetical protein
MAHGTAERVRTAETRLSSARAAYDATWDRINKAHGMGGSGLTVAAKAELTPEWGAYLGAREDLCRIKYGTSV